MKLSPFGIHLKTIFDTWKRLSRNWVISLSNKFVVIFFLLSLGFLLWRFPNLPPQVPLWYIRPWGLDRLANPLWLFILPVGSLCIYIGNLLVASWLKEEELVFVQMIFLTSMVVNFLSFVTLIKIIFLVS